MKFLIVGSAPSANIVPNCKDKIKNYYYDEIYCINNAWFLLNDVNKFWTRSTDFYNLGTLFPEEKDKEFIIEEITEFLNIPLWYDQINLGSGTMFLNTLYHIINKHCGKKIEIDVIGSDFDYSNKNHTHFYGLGKYTEETNQLIKQNSPECEGVAADPLRYGKNILLKELEKNKSDR